MAVPSVTPPVPLDLSTLSGLSYACRPECGLCCYAEPLVAPSEKSDLLRIVPASEFVRRGRYEFLRSNPDGGACRLLSANRCGAHRARPAPCREFPLTGHVGSRVQVTAVLSCPGVDLSWLRGYRGPEGAAPPRGFDSELTALRGRLDRSLPRLLDTTGRRGRRIENALRADGRWVGTDEVRRTLRAGIPAPREEDFPVEDPPEREEGLATLPIFYRPDHGPIALAGRPEGWELLELSPAGGVRRSLGVASPPDRPPGLSDDAARALEGYLRYWLERDQLFGFVHLAMLENDGGSVTERVTDELRGIAATTVSRAHVLATLGVGSVDRLSADEVLEGIRATDQDLLDRASWGTRV
jgi:Putative zinc- or iron-chelating domain